MIQKIKLFWKWLKTPFKIVFCIWFVYSLSALEQINFFQWIVVWFVGVSIFVLLPQLLVDMLKTNKINKIERNSIEYLNKCKLNFNKLNEVEKGFYNEELKIMLDQVKTDAMIVNSTTEVKSFIEHFEHMLKTLRILSIHEYTGYFNGSLPSKNLQTILEEKTLTEIKFVKRSFLKNEDGSYIVNSGDKKYIHYFTERTRQFIQTGIEPKIKREEVKKNIYDFDSMDGHEFEYFCADLLRKNNFGNVEVTQGSGDHGIDILAEKDGITYAIQCKCYSKDIGNAAVQQAHTGKVFTRKI